MDERGYELFQLPSHRNEPMHLLNCKYLLGKSELGSYIPDYSDIYNSTLEEMVYTGEIIKDNFKKLNTKRTM